MKNNEKVEIPADRAKLYENLVGKQVGDNVTIKNESTPRQLAEQNKTRNAIESGFGFIAKAWVAIVSIAFIVSQIFFCIKFFETNTFYNITFFAGLTLAWKMISGVMKLAFFFLLFIIAVEAVIGIIETITLATVEIHQGNKFSKMADNADSKLDAIRGELNKKDEKDKDPGEKKSPVEFGENANQY